MSLFEIVVEPQVRRRRVRRPLSGKKRAATLFRVWHGLRELNDEAERLGDGELVHFLEIARLLVGQGCHRVLGHRLGFRRGRYQPPELGNSRMRVLVALLVLLAAVNTARADDVSKVGVTTRDVVPAEPYDWRGARTHALRTMIWYPAAAGAREE